MKGEKMTTKELRGYGEELLRKERALQYAISESKHNSEAIEEYLEISGIIDEIDRRLYRAEGIGLIPA